LKGIEEDTSNRRNSCLQDGANFGMVNAVDPNCADGQYSQNESE